MNKVPRLIDGKITVYNRRSILAFCDKHHIEISKFNQPVIIHETARSTHGMFENCESFNQPIILPGNLRSTKEMFAGCRSFNQPITIPEKVTDCTSMFDGCCEFNQPIRIPSSVFRCSRMFAGCSKFNQPIEIPRTVAFANSMFVLCQSLTQDITIPLDVVQFYHIIYKTNVQTVNFVWDSDIDEFDSRYVITQQRIRTKDLTLNGARRQTRVMNIRLCEPEVLRKYLGKQCEGLSISLPDFINISGFDGLLEYKPLPEMSAQLLKFKSC